jgi:hypothetical protein
LPTFTKHKEIKNMDRTIKKTALRVLAALSMTVAGTAIAATSGGAAEHKHEHGAAPATLQLDAGKKWETDAALRQAMGNIRQTMAASLHEIHKNKLAKKGYATLAHQVESEVGEIVANCKLAPKADAQLHLIVAELLTGAEQMAGKTKPINRQNGAVQVINALEKYSLYFDDVGFKPIRH